MSIKGGEIEVLPSKKFELIYNVVSKDSNVLNVQTLCEYAGVSRSGYYNWVNSADKRQAREDKDRADFEEILEAYRYRGYPKGAREIYMHLLHKEKVMNLKKIRRLMNKYGLKCPIRALNPYKQMARNMRTNHVAPNVVNREFFSHGARKILLTDITYMPYKGNICYLSTILDAFTREILAYELSKNLRVDFVLNTVDKMIQEYGAQLDNTTIIHSDQGCHYTSLAFINKLRSNEFIQSMSRKGNCWDNAPQESFFGHMKDEIKGYIKEYTEFEQVKERIDDWIDYYNTERYQWSLAKLSPREYYQYVTIGIYPLKKFLSPWGSAPNPEV